MKQMLRTKSSWFLLLVAVTALAGKAQAQYFGLEQGQAAPVQVGVQYQATKANAPPGQCGCFWMQGGGLQIHRAFFRTWGLAADVSYASNSNVNGNGQTLSVFNYLLGPRYTYRNTTRYTPFAEALIGASHVSSNAYVYQSNNTYLAAQVGAGVEMYFRPHISFVPLELDYVYSRALNGVNKHQNNVRVGFGIVYRPGPVR